MNIFTKLLAPKNKIFYELFEKSADNVKLMGQLLTQVVGEPDFDKRQGIISQMEDVEHANSKPPCQKIPGYCCNQSRHNDK